MTNKMMIYPVPNNIREDFTKNVKHRSPVEYDEIEYIETPQIKNLEKLRVYEYMLDYRTTRFIIYGTVKHIYDEDEKHTILEVFM